MSWFAAFVVLGLLGVALLRLGMRYGSTPEERARVMPGDTYLTDGPRVRLAMTRAVTIQASPERVWPWIAQLGRGAGWYSIDRLDNGGKTSARHLVSWVPEPALGDATAIGYLRHIDVGRSVAWWLDGGSFVGSRARLVSSYVLVPDGQGTRVISRISADTAGCLAVFAMLVFALIDSIMASRQLIGLRDRVERYQHSTEHDPETGDRAQYQLYEIRYASGESAGVPGKEEAGRWRRAAVEDGVLRE